MVAPQVRLLAFYDLKFGPISFDFVTWLVIAMYERDLRGCDGLHVVIVPNERGLGGFSRDWGGYDEHAARWRLWHICVASVPLARATVTLTASEAQAREMARHAAQVWWPEGKAHFMGPLVDAAGRGEAIPRLRATEQARKYVRRAMSDGIGPYVTMTIRRQESGKDRNSDLVAWGEMRRHVEALGYRVTWVDDAHDALDTGRGYAELDPDLRLALYEGAAMNLIGNNGPQELLKFSEAPFLVFGVGLGGWADHFRKYFNMEPGEQLPWARPDDQRLVYEPDSFEVMRREFDRWEATSGRATSSS